MAYVKEHAPSEVYHLTKKENLNSILEDGMIRRFSDTECWFCADLPKMKAYMEQTVMCEGKHYYSVTGQLCRYPSQATGTSCTEQRQDVEGGHSAQLVTVEHHTAGQTATIFIRHGKQLPRQRLYHQARHEVLGGVLFRQDEEDGGLLRRKLLGIDGAVEAQHLLQLRVQEGVEPRQHCGHDGGHGLLRGVQCGTGKPSCFVCIRHPVHQKREPVFAANAGGRQQFLYQLEYGHDMPALYGAYAWPPQ